MSALGRRGFTLIELLVALILLSAVTAAIYRALVTNQRTYQAQTQRIDLQQNIRAAVTILPAEFRELDATDGDIIAMATDSITIRAMRQFAVVCARPLLPALPPFVSGVVQATSFTVRQDPQVYSAARDLQVGDGLLVYYEGDEASRNDDGWVVGQVTGLSGGNCPDGRPGYGVSATLTFDAFQLNRLGAIQNGAPVRGFQTVTYLRYQAADGRYYIGLRVGVDLQPVIGPVTANGMTLVYRDAAGAVTADPNAVATIEFQVRGETAQPVHRGAGEGGGLTYPVDSVSMRVALRNNRRF